MSQVAISRVISGERNPSPELCRSIARVFGIPPEDVYRRAGLLPAIEDVDKMNLSELVDLFKNLDASSRMMLLRIAREFYSGRKPE